MARAMLKFTGSKSKVNIKTVTRARPRKKIRKSSPSRNKTKNNAINTSADPASGWRRIRIMGMTITKNNFNTSRPFLKSI